MAEIENKSLEEGKDVYVQNYKDDNTRPEHANQVEARLSEYAKHMCVSPH